MSEIIRTSLIKVLSSGCNITSSAIKRLTEIWDHSVI